VIKDKFGKDLDGWVKTFAPFLFKRPVDPNLLTVLGTAVCVCAAVAFAQGHLLTGALLLWGGGLFDLVDGVVARHFQISSAFGAFLDSTLDRLVDMAVLIGLCIHFAVSGDVVTALVAGVALAASVLTSYTKARAESLDIELNVGIIERGERLILIVAGGVFGLMEFMLWLLAAGATATVVQRFTAARRSSPIWLCISRPMTASCMRLTLTPAWSCGPGCLNGCCRCSTPSTSMKPTRNESMVSMVKLLLMLTPKPSAFLPLLVVIRTTPFAALVP